MPYEPEKLLEKARKCFKLVTDAESKQREREREDLEFQIPENQWSEAAKRERSGGVQGGVLTPPRPMLSISLLRQPMQLVFNQFTRARLGVNLHPVSEDANDELAEIKQGLYRRIERDGGATQARGWGFMRSLACGRGWYRVVTRYDEDADPSGPGAWDQEIAFERILHQESVYMDPAATKADFSDAKWALETVWMPEEDFKREFPDAQASQFESTMEWAALEREMPEWVRHATEGEERAILVARYWYKEIDREVLIGPKGMKRVREKVRLYCARVAGNEVLEEPYEWNGPDIPLIPLIGEELIPVNGDRRWQGMIRPARDAQMAYNYAISAAVEDIGRLSKSPYIGAVGTFETDRAKWDSLNVRNYPYVEYDPLDVSGKPVPPPQPFPIDGTKLQLSLAMADQSRDMVQAATAVHEPSLGEMPSKREAQSGRAILALQQQAEAGTSQFTQNLVDVTLQYEARVVLGLMPAIYDRPGRVTSLVTGEDETQTVMLGAPFVTENGRPAPARPGDPNAKAYDLSKGKFGVSIDIGKSPQTRLQAGQQFMTEVVAAAPELMTVIGDLLFQFRDEPGAKEISERLKKMIQAQHPDFFDEQQTGAEAAAAENQALKAQLQQISGQAQQMSQYIQTEQAKHQAQVATAQLKAQADVEIAKMNNAAKVLVARISSDSDVANAQAEAQEELLATGIKVRAEAEKGAAEHQHERQMQHEKLAHETAMAAAGGNTMNVSRSKGRDGEREESREESDSGSTERSEQDQPPQAEAP